MPIIWQDSFENGFTPWTYSSPESWLVAGGGVSPVGQGSGVTAALVGSSLHSGNAMQGYLPGGTDTWITAYKSLSGYYPTLYMSSWTMFNASIPSGATLLFGPCICGYNDDDLACSHIYNTGTPLWCLKYYTNAGMVMHTSTAGPAIKTNTWYNVQLLAKVGNGNGEAAMWIKEYGQSQFTLIADVVGLINDGDKGPNQELGAHNVQVGPAENESWLVPGATPFAATTWHDDIVVSTDFIGGPIDLIFSKAYTGGVVSLTLS